MFVSIDMFIMFFGKISYVSLMQSNNVHFIIAITLLQMYKGKMHSTVYSIRSIPLMSATNAMLTMT